MAAKGQFIKIPLITGANSDEGVGFSNTRIDSDKELASWLQTWRSYNLSSASIQQLITLYDKYEYPPYSANATARFAGYGRKGRKSGAIGGDMVIIAQRRKVALAYAGAGQRVWSFRFDTPLWNAKESDGARHGAEVVFTFQNITGELGPRPEYQRYKELSDGMGAAYVNFVNRYDPNDANNSSQSALPRWPSYSEKPVNLVLNANHVHLESDDWRAKGMAFINSISRELLS